MALSVATRPDCLPDAVIALLQRLNAEKPVWVELGLQTIHPRSAAYIRRGYDLPVFDDAVRRLRAAGLEVIVHQILGIPGETDADMVQTARYIGQCGAQGIKLHLLHVLRGTDLAADYAAGGSRCSRGALYRPARAVSARPPAGDGHPPSDRRRRQARPHRAALERGQKARAQCDPRRFRARRSGAGLGTVTLFQVLTMRREIDFIHGICEFCRRMDSAYPGAPKDKDDIEVKLVEHISCQEFLALRSFARDLCTGISRFLTYSRENETVSIAMRIKDHGLYLCNYCDRQKPYGTIAAADREKAFSNVKWLFRRKLYASHSTGITGLFRTFSQLLHYHVLTDAAGNELLCLCDDHRKTIPLSVEDKTAI